ncbi:MAG: CotH kinase family protein [Clostridiales bacterium]|nr:CotH kinase family protein [Clostridiales bacterium]
MKQRIRKLLCLIMCCIMAFTMLVACNPQVPPNNPDTPPPSGEKHTCSHPCPDCGGCLDDNCNDASCQIKCDCEDPGFDEHVCSKTCPKCGRCLDDGCDNYACQPKCSKDHSTDDRYSFYPVISDEMPVVMINTTDGSNDFVTVPDRDAKLNGQIEYVDATITIQDGSKTPIDNVVAKVKARGNYTLDYDKKPIRIKFDKKQSVLGLNGGAKFKNWVLLADWKDLSMSNNPTAFYLGKTILGSDGYYASDFRSVEVYLNGEYWGVYLLVEQQESKGDDGRTSVPAVDDDYTGTDIGYLVEYDAYYTDERNMPNNSGDPTFELNYNNYAPLKKLNGNNLWSWQRGYTVKSDIYDSDQLEFIRSFMDNAYRIAYQAVYEGRYYKFNSDYTDTVPTSGTAKEIVSAVIDVQSLVDTYILSEIACDPDIAWSSFYISLDMTQNGSHKLIFEAPWDFDSAFGIKQGFSSSYNLYAANSDNPWLILLVNEQWFRDMVRAKWAELVENDVLTTALVLINSQKTVYEQYYARNYERWEDRIIYGNGELIGELNSYTTQGQAANYLYNWLGRRFNYLNQVWGDGSGESSVPSKPEEGSTRYRFEAEDCYYDYPITEDDWHSELASGGLFLGQIEGSYGAQIILTVTVEQDCTAFLSVGVSKRSFDAVFNDWFAVSVNGDALDMPMRIVPACSNGETEWVAWTDVYLMPIELTAGVNTITFTTLRGKASNVDYFDIWSTTPIFAA